MHSLPRRSDPLILASTAVMAVAWGVLALEPAGTARLVLCGSAPAEASLGLLLAATPPGALVAGWWLMLAATMPPLIVAPLRQLRRGNFARWRSSTTILFLAGYAAAWTAAGPALYAFALALRLGPAPFAAGLGLAAALVWQASPLKQRCLNACHRDPRVDPFGWAAHRDAHLFGLARGAWCVGTCWTLMVLPLLADRGHLAVMAAVAGLLSAERLDRPAPPAWRWRVPVRAARLVAARLRPRLPGPAHAGKTR